MPPTSPYVIQPRRSPIWWWKPLAIGLVAVVVAFFAGRFEDRFARRELTLEQTRLATRVRELEGELQSVQNAQTNAAQAQQVDALAATELRATVKALQDSVKELEKENSFYRTIMNPASEKTGLQIDSVSVVPFGSDNRFRLRVILTQLRQHEKNIKGRIKVSVFGSGAPVEAFLESDAGKFNFQYFQNLETDLQLPANFSPRDIRITATAEGPQAKAVEKTFPWPQADGKTG